MSVLGAYWQLGCQNTKKIFSKSLILHQSRNTLKMQQNFRTLNFCAILMLVCWVNLSISLPQMTTDIEPKDVPKPSKFSRIVSGSIAKPNEFPFVVSLVWKSTGALLCGGSIYNEKTIVTAAHCVMEEKEPPFSIFHFLFTPVPKFAPVAKKRLMIAAGENHLFKLEGTEQFRSVAKIIVHPQYAGDKEPYDIALIVLDKPLVYNKNVKAIKLAPKGYLALGIGTIVGWGVDKEGRRTNVLKKGKVPIVPEIVCSVIYSYFLIFSNICAGGATQDTCYGDSGGPLLCGDPQVLCGITSYGSGCAKLLRPAAYTKVNYFYDWILQNSAKCGQDCKEPNTTTVASESLRQQNESDY